MFSPKMQMWYIEAHEELGIEVEPTKLDMSYAIYPKRFFNAVELLSKKKIYEFNFIGAYKIDKETFRRRQWVVDFAKKRFHENCYLQFTDKKTKLDYVPLGVFDRTLSEIGFVPKETPREERNWFDERYFQILCSSQFTLCPGGDLNWSMRFYEALMCRSIPILPSRDCFRNQKEADLPYKYLLPSDDLLFNPDWVEHNHELFTRYHTLSAS